VPLTGLAPRGTTPTAQVDNELGGKRYDVIDSCGWDGLGPVAIITPADRDKQGVRGIGVRHVVSYIDDQFGPWLAQQHQPRIIIAVDGSRAHSEKKIVAAVKEAVPDTVVKFWRLPPYAGKFLNPLDNNLHSIIRRRFQRNIAGSRRRPQDMKAAITSAFKGITVEQTRAAYRHCGLLGPA
jgi:hypothetical protein